MPAVSRLGDLCTGHGCFPPRTGIDSSPNVRANGITVHRVTDTWNLHSCPPAPPHGGAIASGSSTVIVNGFQLARIGDPIDCGSNMAEGSPTVFAGG